MLPTYLHADLLPKALDSVAAQTFTDFLCTVVVDGSPDDAVAFERWQEHSKDDRFICINLKQNGGTANAINVGMANARGRWVTWVSADNVMHPGWLAALLDAVKDHEEREDVNPVGAVYSAFNMVDAEGRLRHVFYHPYRPDALVTSTNCFFGPSFLVKKRVWRRTGAQRGRTNHDYDHWLRVEECCWLNHWDIIDVREPLCEYNTHDNRATIYRAHEADAAQWQQAACERRAKLGLVGTKP